MKESSYIALLRGINVGGNKKVSMSLLKAMMENMGFQGVKTVLNSGNIVFTATETPETLLEEKISTHLEKTFGFSIPVVVRKDDVILRWIASAPFEALEIYKDLRLYVTFVKYPFEKNPLDLPWVSEDKTFRIIEATKGEIISYLNVSKTKTTDAMNILEKAYGKEITTRNWNTMLKIAKLF